MGRVGVGGGPFDAEEKALCFGAGTAGRIHVDFAIQNFVHEVSVTIDVVTGIADGLRGDRTVGEFVGWVDSPW